MSAASGLFITSSGTGIGKTYVSVRFIREFQLRGREISVLKPVMSGYDETNPQDSDAGVLLAALGKSVTAENVNALSPFRFKAPLSPDMAARQEGRRLDFAGLVDFTRQALHQAKTPLLVEGIGGVMVPLDDKHTVRDWISACALPALLVTGSYLGSLSHTLTACEALANAGVKLAGVVINESENSTIPLAETKASLAHFLPRLPIATLERHAPVSGKDAYALAGIFDFL